MIERRLVVAAVIRGGDGRVLLARRPPGRHLEGLWEFPGGRVEEGETAEVALARELDEELGVTVSIGEPLTFAWHRDATREILLLFYRAELTGGAPHGREGQEVGWFHAEDLPALATPPADAALMQQLAKTRKSE
ncbi:MAG TPA: (deoxy)nucleoside triphosphate pyrophosphohydrolase [Thermoanaerobaculaceae bacterium]|nr:(deoxy)nucleoside triphosphate pyrophosphohydrolase [Thermoanaerobaculaceae bacterium]HPS78424.1 (deoxy)nucleoside triphosphate pyrophosphohydrolase [Thermoanaerobaculaceae bacterium]